MSDEQEVWDALAALLKATSLGDDVYDYGDVPGEDGNLGVVPPAFALLSVARRYVTADRSGATSVTGYRATVRFVGTSAVNARTIGGWVRSAFEVTPGRGKRVTVSGQSARIKFESANDVEPDNGRYSGLLIYTL